MMPFIPHSVIEQHAREHLGRHALRQRGPSAHDPDGFLGTYDESPPDPVFMAIRQLMTTGPVGALKARFERWNDNRRDARSITGSPEPAATGSLPGASVAAIPDDDAARPAAA
jgi:hypothetical protein